MLGLSQSTFVCHILFCGSSVRFCFSNSEPGGKDLLCGISFSFREVDLRGAHLLPRTHADWLVYSQLQI